MAFQNDHMFSFKAKSSTGIDTGLRVKFDAGTNKLVPAGVADVELFVTKGNSPDANRVVACKRVTGDGTLEVRAAGAITAFSTVKRAAGGKVAADGLGTDFGIALEDATADGDIIEVIPL